MQTKRSGPVVSMIADHRLGAVVTIAVDDAHIPAPRREDANSGPARTTALVVEVERRPGNVLVIRHHEVGSPHELAALIRSASDEVEPMNLGRLRARSSVRVSIEDTVPERRLLRALGGQLRTGTVALVVLCSRRDAAALHRVLTRTHPEIAKAALSIGEQDDAVRALRAGGLAALQR